MTLLEDYYYGTPLGLEGKYVAFFVASAYQGTTSSAHYLVELTPEDSRTSISVGCKTHMELSGLCKIPTKDQL